MGIIEIISVITSAQLLLFSFFLFNYKKGENQSHLILSAFLFANSFFIIGFLFQQFRNQIPFYSPLVYYLGSSFGFLFGPTLFLYTKSVTDKNFFLKRIELLHLLPSLLYWIVILFQTYSSEIKFIKSYLTGIMHLQIMIYMFASLKILDVYRKEIKKIFSAIEKLNLSWLNTVVIAFILMWLIDLMHFFLFKTGFKNSNVFYVMTIISLSINFIFANLIIYKGLKQPEFFSGFDIKISKTKYEKSNLSTEDAQNYLKKLAEFMESDKPFLIPSLTITELADKLSIHSKYLSQIINENFNQNFFDFINSYRIEEAKKLLQVNSSKKKTILEILYEVGFNSKSVFNTAFKHHTGTTPTVFRKMFDVFENNKI